MFTTRFLSFRLFVTLLCLTLGVGVLLFAIGPASSETLDDPRPYGISILAPLIAENGAVVPVSVETHGFEGREERIEEVRLYVCHMGFRPVARFVFKQHPEKVSTRLKMGRTDRLFAVARLNTGEYLYAEQVVKVTIGSCGGGGGFYVTPMPDATTPAQLSPGMSRSWVRSSLPENAARLVTLDGRALELRAVRADVKIAGFRARVLLDVEFYNPHERLGEGRFELRLPDRASPYYVAFGDVVLHDETGLARRLPGPDAGFAKAVLDYDRQTPPARLKAGVMVPRDTARLAYNTITWAQRDPALVEWQGSGVYSVQVYPLQPRKRHRMLIAYDTDLKTQDGEWQYRFTPLSAEVPVDVYVRIDEADARALREVTPLSDATRMQNTFFHRRLENGEPFELRFGVRDNLVLHGEDAATGHYFAARLVPELPSSLALPGTREAVMMLDTSAHPGGAWFHGQAELMLALLEANADSIDRFAVLFFDVGTHWWRPYFVDNTSRQRERLRRDLYDISLSGATDLQRALAQAGAPDWLGDEVTARDIFLFSDGLATWGDARPEAMLAALDTPRVARLFAYAPRGYAADGPLLALLGAHHEGAVFSYTTRSGVLEDKDVLSAHRFLAWRVEEASAEGAYDVVLAEPARDLYPGQVLRVIGRGRPGSAMYLKLRAGERIAQLRVPLHEAGIATDLAPRLYGEAVVQRIESAQPPDTQVALAYATHFRIARQTASLLMLEGEADYRRFGIDSAPDYTSLVRAHSAARYLAALPTPVETLPDPGPLTRSQLEELDVLARGVSVCRIPPEAFAVLGGAKLEARAPLARSALETGDVLFGEPHRARADTPPGIEARLLEAQRMYRWGAGLAALRSLSAAVDDPALAPARREQVAGRVLEMGYGNDSYFLLRSYAETHALSPEAYAVLARAARGEGADALADTLLALPTMIADPVVGVGGTSRP